MFSSVRDFHAENAFACCFLMKRIISARSRRFLGVAAQVEIERQNIFKPSFHLTGFHSIGSRVEIRCFQAMG
jgi:hypothetical protein